MMPSVASLLQVALPSDGGIGFGVLAGLLLVVLLAGLVALFVSRYKRCPANKVLVISGRVAGNNALARVISGGGAFVWPVIQEFAYLDLTPLPIDIPLKDALSAENIRVAVPSIFTVAIGQDPESQQNAAARLLSIANDPSAIKRLAQDIIFGVMRSVIASMKIEEVNKDRDALLTRIQHQLEPELKKIGLVLTNVNITDLKDESGYIEAIGRKAAATAVQQARADVADQEKIGTIRVAEAERERAVQVANAEKDREIGLSAADREKAVRIAELDRERIVGEQQAAFQRDIAVKEAEQTKRVAVAAADAKAIAGEADAAAMIAQTRSQLAVKEAEAFQQAETRKREAEAAVQEAQNRAQARAALANAERVEAEQRAALEAPAKAEKARMIVEAEADAERVRLAAAAERDRLEAIAAGEAAILQRRAEALGTLIDKAGGAQQAFALLMVENIPMIAKTAADAIANIKIDKITVWDGGQGGAGSTAGFLRNMATSLPPVMHLLKDITGVELPSYLGSMTPEGTPVLPVAAPAAKGTPAGHSAPVAEAALPPLPRA